MPPLSVWAFYWANLFAVSGYCVAIALVTRRKGFHGRGRLPLPLAVAACLFFLCCSGIHLELAVLTFTRVLTDVTGNVPWHFLMLVMLKVAALYTYLWTAAAATDSPPLAPPVGQRRFLTRREREVAAVHAFISRAWEVDARDDRLRRSVNGGDHL